MTATAKTTPARKPGRPKGSRNATPRGRRSNAQVALQGEVLTGPPPKDIVATDVAITTTTNKRRLTTIATSIRKEFGKGLDAQFAMGRLLNEARELLVSDTEFGKWVAGQGFGFSQPTAYRLGEAAKREPEVRAFIEAEAKANRDISATTAVKELTAGPKPSQELKDVGKRVRDLLAEEPPTTGFAAFQQCANDLDLSTFSVNELADFAATIQSLVEAYGAERKRRSA